MFIADIKRVVEQVSRDKGIDVEILIRALEEALRSAARKKFGSKVDIEAQYSPDTGEIEVFQFKEVVDTVTEPDLQISFAEGRKLDPDCEVGDSLGTKMDTSTFGRIAAQSAKQVIIQKMKDAERDAVYSSYIDRKGEVINGIVQRVDRGNIIVNLGDGVSCGGRGQSRAYPFVVAVIALLVSLTAVAASRGGVRYCVWRCTGDWDRRGASFVPRQARDEVFLKATKNLPHPQLVEGRTALKQRTRRRRAAASGLRCRQDHPRHAEAVGDHAETGREEGLGQRHLDLAAVGQRVERAIGRFRIRQGEGERDALEARLAGAAAVGRHDYGIADAHAAMHDLVGVGRHGAIRARRLGVVLEAQQHLDLGAEGLLVELDRFLAASVEIQIGLDQHGALLF